MKRKMTAMLSLVLALVLMLAGCAGKTQKPEGMEVDVRDGKVIRTGTEFLTYQVEPGQVGTLSIRILRESGGLNLDVYPTEHRDAPEYTGRDMDSASFDVILTAPGEYTVLFTANKFTGEYAAEWKTQ